MTAHISFFNGHLKGESRTLTEEPFRLGRDPKNDCAIDDPMLDPFHLILYPQGNGDYLLIDLNSGGGTYTHPTGRIFIELVKENQDIFAGGNRFKIIPLPQEKSLNSPPNNSLKNIIQQLLQVQEVSTLLLLFLGGIHHLISPGKAYFEAIGDHFPHPGEPGILFSELTLEDNFPFPTGVPFPVSVNGNQFGIVHVEDRDETSIQSEEIQLLIKILELKLEAFEREERLQSWSNRESALDNLKEKFILTMFHELNTPLTLVSVPLSVLINNPADKSLPKYLNMMKEGCLRLNSFLKDLTLYLEVHRPAYKPETKSSVISNIQDELEKVKIKFTRQLDFRDWVFKGCGEKPAEFVFDPHWLEFILSRITENSIHFSENGTPLVWTLTHFPKQIQLSLSDQGCGISSEFIKDIFKVFQPGVPLMNIQKNRGLSLPIAKKMMEIFGGKLYLHSNGVGTGCTLFLIFKRSPENMVF